MRAKYDAYLRSQDINTQTLDFFDRMKKDKEMRDNKKAQME